MDKGKREFDLQFVLSDISQFKSKLKYDLVICEGVIPLQFEPKAMAAHVLECVRPGGAVVLTTFDSVSGFSEIARRYIAYSVFENLNYSEELVERLTQFFAPDFAALPGMSRRPEDWVLDSILNPWLGDFFSLEDALEVAGSDFALLGTSPNLFQDWRWYKDPSVRDRNNNLDILIHSYRSNVHSLLDARFVCREALDPSTNVQLMELTSRIADRVRDFINSGVPYDTVDFGRDVQNIAACVKDAHPDTIDSLLSLVRWSSTGNEVDLTAFRRLWGRGQQYISLVRCS